MKLVGKPVPPAARWLCPHSVPDLVLVDITAGLDALCMIAGSPWMLWLDHRLGRNDLFVVLVEDGEGHASHVVMAVVQIGNEENRTKLFRSMKRAKVELGTAPLQSCMQDCTPFVHGQLAQLGLVLDAMSRCKIGPPFAGFGNACVLAKPTLFCRLSTAWRGCVPSALALPLSCFVACRVSSVGLRSFKFLGE